MGIATIAGSNLFLYTGLPDHIQVAIIKFQTAAEAQDAKQKLDRFPLFQMMAKRNTVQIVGTNHIVAMEDVSISPWNEIYTLEDYLNNFESIFERLDRQYREFMSRSKDDKAQVDNTARGSHKNISGNKLFIDEKKRAKNQ